jgi:hypothetical protein
MSPRRVRFEARVFRGESVAFEACTSFRAGAQAGTEADTQDGVCHCGWLEDDHRAARPPAVAPLRRRAPAVLPVLARRAS